MNAADMRQYFEADASPRRLGETVHTAEVLGHATDFVMSSRSEADRVIITVSAVLPAMRWDGHALQTWAPPRYPRP